MLVLTMEKSEKFWLGCEEGFLPVTHTVFLSPLGTLGKVFKNRNEKIEKIRLSTEETEEREEREERLTISFTILLRCFLL